jgi:predicted phosphodiesterase
MDRRARWLRWGAVIAFTTLLQLTVGAAPFVHGPYAGAPCADAVTISWTCSPPSEARVEYGLRDEYESTGELPMAVTVRAMEDEDDPCHVILSGLEPSTEYKYRVVLSGEEEISSAVGSFVTEPASGEPVTFAVLADTQLQSEGVNRLEMIADAIAADPTPFQFILHGGDIVETPSSYFWDHWFSSFDDMLLRSSFIPVLGNHENNHRSYYEAFCLPPGAGKEDERWWALHWGDVVVVGLDSNVKKATDYVVQQEWARAHLAGPEPHKFVVFHHPVFTSDAYHTTGSFLDRIFHPIFVETEVDIVFNGHSHHYEHIVRDGVTYLVVGGGGATPRQTKPDHIQGSDVSIEGHFFYSRVSTTADRIDVETVSVGRLLPDDAVEATGHVLDAFSLPEQEIAETGSSFSWLAVAALLLGAGLAAWLLLRTAAQ